MNGMSLHPYPKGAPVGRQISNLLRPFAHRVMLFQNTLIQRARFKHGRSTWRDRFSNLNQALFPGLWNAEVKATSQIAPCVVQKAPLLIRSGKYLICACEGVVLHQCDLIIRTSVVWLGTTWCKINFYFVRSCFILYRILGIWHLHVHGDQITTNIQSTWQYLCIFSAVLARLCKFYGVANRCIYSAECDGCACRECQRVAIDNGIYWSALNLTALSERSWFSPRLKKSLNYNVRPAARVSRRYLPQPARVFNC